MERVRVNLGFRSCFVVDAVGHSGGMAFLWSTNFYVHVSGYSKYHVDATVSQSPHSFS